MDLFWQPKLLNSRLSPEANTGFIDVWTHYWGRPEKFEELQIMIAKLNIAHWPRVFILTAFLIFISGTAELDHDGSQFVQAAPGQEVIDLISLVASSVTIVPANIEFGALDPGTMYSKQGMLDVKGTGHWIVRVSSDGQPKAGYMSEYAPENGLYIGPNGKQLTNSMTIRAFDKGDLVGQVDLKNGGQLVQGEGRKSYTIYFDQAATWKDEPLIQNHIYRLVVTFLYRT
jgi:hypothetical protein